MESNSSSDQGEDSKSQRGPTIKSKPNKGKTLISYNKRGVPIGEGAKKLVTFEGMVARNMVPIIYESWTNVRAETKQELWEYVLEYFILDPKSRKQIIQSIGIKWRNFKHYLYTNYIENHIDNPGAENLLNPPAIYPSIKKDEWKVFVAQRLSKKWQETSKKRKETRAKNIYNHRLSRKGYAGLTVEIMQETGKEEDEIDRSLLWKKARERKTGGFDSNVQEIVNKIDALQKSGINVEDTCGQHDVLTQALGTEEQRGHVRGMGKFVTPRQYFFLPKTMKQIMDTEKKKVDQRFVKLEDEVEKLKRGMNNASEAESCQMWGNEDFEDEPHEEPCGNSCYLAVEVATNIVATGTVLMETSEKIQVMMECSLKGESSLPIPLEEELIFKVKDGVGHILSWPAHLVIHVSELKKAVRKPIARPLPEIESKKSNKRLQEHDEELEKNNGKEKETGKAIEVNKEKTGNLQPNEENEKPKGKGNDRNKDKETIRKKRTRAQRKTRVRIEKSVALTMAALVADGQVSKVDSIKVQCEDDCFGYESFTYLSMEDFEAVFTLDWLSGSVVTAYMMFLYERIKNGPIPDRGICFVIATATMTDDRKVGSIHIDESSKIIANRLTKRNNNDIIIVPYNPGKHWVLAVLDMKTTTCYYLDSLRPINVNPQLRQIIDAAMALYAVKTGSNKRVKVNWVNSRCPTQPGSTECGYYILNIMKEIVDEGLEILVNNNVGGGKEEYTEADFDEVREEWSSYATQFVFR